MLDTLKKSFGDLYPCLLNENCSEIIVNSNEEIYFCERGEVQRFEGETGDVFDMIKAMAELADIESIEETNDLQFNFGLFYVYIFTPRVSRKGYCFNLFRQVYSSRDERIDLDLLEKFKSIRKEGKDLLKKSLEKGNKSILVGGGPSAGSYTLVESLMFEIPESQRIVTIEQIPTMPIDNPFSAQLICPNGKRSELSNLVHSASMIRADYIIISELFGKEAFSYTELLRDGHNGISHVKGSNIYDVLKRLEDKILSHPEVSYRDAKYAICEAFDLIVYHEKLESGDRRITSIAELELVEGDIKLKFLYQD